MLVKKHKKTVISEFLKEVLDLEESFKPRWFHPWWVINRKQRELKRARTELVKLARGFNNTNKYTYINVTDGETRIHDKLFKSPLIVNDDCSMHNCKFDNVEPVAIFMKNAKHINVGDAIAGIIK